MSDEWSFEVTQGTDDVKEYTEIKEGTYVAFIDKATGTESNGGTPYLNLQWRIVGGDFDNKCAFQKVWGTKKSQKMYNDLMVKLGIFEQITSLKTTDEILAKSAELLTNANNHYEIYINYKDSDCGQYRNQNVYINSKFEGEVREDSANHAPVPTFDKDSELPF